MNMKTIHIDNEFACYLNTITKIVEAFGAKNAGLTEKGVLFQVRAEKANDLRTILHVNGILSTIIG